MRSYRKLASGDERFIANTKKRLVKERNSTCAGCLKKTWAPNLDVYVIDDEKQPDDGNLVLLDQACHNSIVLLSFQLHYSNDDGIRDWHRQIYGGQRDYSHGSK